MEIVYDPLFITSESITEFLKQSTKLHEKLKKDFGHDFNSLRKVNSNSLFSFTFMVFALDTLPDILNGLNNSFLEIKEYHEF